MAFPSALLYLRSPTATALLLLENFSLKESKEDAAQAQRSRVEMAELLHRMARRFHLTEAGAFASDSFRIS